MEPCANGVTERMFCCLFSEVPGLMGKLACKVLLQYKINAIIIKYTKVYCSIVDVGFDLREKLQREFCLIYVLKNNLEISEWNDGKKKARKRIFSAQDLA